MSKRKKANNIAASGRINPFIQLVQRPGIFSRERKTERAAIKQEEKAARMLDCRFCAVCKDDCVKLRKDANIRRTYLKGGMLVTPDSPYYQVNPDDVVRVDDNGDIIQLPGGIDVKQLAAVVAEQLRGTAQAAAIGSTSNQECATTAASSPSPEQAQAAPSATEAKPKAETPPAKEAAPAPKPKTEAAKQPPKKIPHIPTPEPPEEYDGNPFPDLDEPEQIDIDDII